MSRIEEDSLGKLEIPEGAPYGIQTLRALALGGLSGKCLGDYPDYVRALLQVKMAAARANVDAGSIDEKTAHFIQEACNCILEEYLPSHFPVDLLIGGGSIALNRNVNETIRSTVHRLYGQSLSESEIINRSQSTADVCHTALRIALYSMAKNLIPKLNTLHSALESKATEWKNIETLSRTCLRDASPTSLGAFIGGMAAGLKRNVTTLEKSAVELLKGNLGGTVIGSGEGATKTYRETVLNHLKSITDLPLESRENLYDAAQNADDLGRFSYSLIGVAQILMKIAKDFRLLASGPEAGINELSLPAVMEGSSFYPGKINPIVPETVMQSAMQIFGNNSAIQAAMEQAELNLTVFESVIASNLFSSLTLLTALAPLFENCIKGTTANVEVCRSYASKGKYGTSKT